MISLLEGKLRKIIIQFEQLTANTKQILVEKREVK